MITAVDTSVLVDVLIDDPKYAALSNAALRKAASEGALILCESSLAEIVPVLGSDEIAEFLSDWNLKFVPSTQESAILAGEMFRVYLKRGGKRGRVVSDFLIAAHAQIHAERFLARDRGYYRDYFKRLKLWDPSE
ncbi:MAG: type II toxin-antitoxin system VapC family toxin [Verrucomicrobiota bacterium]